MIISLVNIFHVIFRVIHQEYGAENTKKRKILDFKQTVVRAPIFSNLEAIQLRKKSGPEEENSGAELTLSGHVTYALGGRTMALGGRISAAYK